MKESIRMNQRKGNKISYDFWAVVDIGILGVCLTRSGARRLRHSLLYLHPNCRVEKVEVWKEIT